MNKIRTKRAPLAGFCFGVRRADMIVSELSRSEKRKVYTFGELIHNGDYIAKLAESGVDVIEKTEDAEEPEKAVCVLRTHGVEREMQAALESRFASVVDATCPFVKKIHKIVSENSAPDVDTVIIGRAGHPEVVGIKSYAKGKVYVFESPEEISACTDENFGKNKAILVSQTTNNTENYKNCQKVLKLLYSNIQVFGTICTVTEKRQAEARKMASENDMMIVVGGKKSSNTKRLYEICRELCGHTYFCENAADLPKEEITAAVNELLRYKYGLSVCITAGASTPDDIIEEVEVTMNNIADNTTKTEIKEGMSFEEMLDSYTKPPRAGERVMGVITSVTPAAIYVDLGIKQTGVLPTSEVTDDPTVDVTETFKVGDEIDVQIVKYNDAEGIVNLSKKKLDGEKNWQMLVDAAENNTTLNGKVIEAVKGGVIMQVGPNRVFVPASHTNFPRTEEGVTDEQLKSLVGNSYDIKILPEVNEQRRRAVGSIRKAASEVRKAQREAFWNDVEVGKKFTGTVKSITPYGAFVDLGGVDGMVHITELSWKRIKHPTEVVNIGDTVDVFVKAVDVEKKRISLGLKTEETNPWNILATKYAEGDVAEVKIVSIMSFGAFAEVIPGVDGLIHISQLADRKVEKPQDVVNVGDVVNAKIISIDYEAKKVSLSIRALLAPEVTEEAAEEAPLVVELPAEENN